MSLTPKYFSQYPGDPSFSFLCNLNFFDQLEIFLEISLLWTKIWNLKFWKIIFTTKCPRVGILKWYQGLMQNLNPWFLNQRFVNSRNFFSKNHCRQILWNFKVKFGIYLESDVLLHRVPLVFWIDERLIFKKGLAFKNGHSVKFFQDNVAKRVNLAA